MSGALKRELRSEALHYVGDAKICKLTGNGGTYPQLRLPKSYANLIGKKAHLFEITKDGQTAFLISTGDGLNPSTEGLNQSQQVLKPCINVAQIPVDVLAKNEPDFTEPLATDSRSKSFAESFIINTWLVSCAASGSHFACASPGSVAAYHGALSRLRLGFKSRLGRFIFDIASRAAFRLYVRLTLSIHRKYTFE